MRQAFRACVVPLTLLFGLHLWKGPDIALRIGQDRAQALSKYAQQTLPERVERYAAALSMTTIRLPRLMDCTAYPYHSPAGYDPDTDTICFDPAFEGGFHLRQKGWRGFLFRTYLSTHPAVRHLRSGSGLRNGAVNVVDADDMLDHEVCHYLTDVIATQEGIPRWYDLDFAPFSLLLGRRMVVEGIATALSHDGECDGFRDPDYPSEWPPLDSDAGGRLIYQGGCNLVAPIVKKYRAAGIAHLLRNPPDTEYPIELPAYREQVMAELENP